jgi:hypothetical protein
MIPDMARRKSRDNMKILKALVGLGFMAASFATASAATYLGGNMTADNAFFAYLGTSPTSLGTAVGSGNAWWQSFALTPTALAPGVTNYLNIEAINYGGPGGVSFVLNLNNTGFQFANGAQVLTTDPGNVGAFTGAYNNDNSSVSVQPWVAAVGAAIQDTGYGWGNFVGTANWADASPLGLNNCANGYCTVDFTVAITPSTAAAPLPVPGAGLLSLLFMLVAGAKARFREILGFARHRLAKTGTFEMAAAKF